MAVIEMPFGFNDLEQVFDLTEFLSNSPELLMKFEPSVKKMIVRKDFFKGHSLRLYNEQFDQLIRTLIKVELMHHFQSWSPEDLLILTEDIDFLKMIASDLFEQDNYRKLGMN